MSESKGIKVASRFVGLLLCMVLMQTALATENQNQFTVNFTNTGNMNSSSLTISPTITQTELAAGNQNKFTANQNEFTANPTNAGNMINSPITISPTITQADIDAGSVTNAAHATGTFGNNTTTSNTDNETVTAVQGSSAFPALIIGKSASPEIYNTVGQNITYTYTVTNYGNVNITGPINVTDNKTGTFTISNIGLAPGHSITGTANYTITQDDLETCNDNATPINDSDHWDHSNDNATPINDSDHWDHSNDNATPINDSDHWDHSNDNATPEVPLESSTYLDNSDNLYGCDYSDDCDHSNDNATPINNSDHWDHSNDNATPICSVTNAAFATGTFGNNTITSNTAYATVTIIQCPESPHCPNYPDDCDYSDHPNDCNDCDHPDHPIIVYSSQ